MPLHIFEPRYRELIGECLETGDEFGLVYTDEDGVRDIGTRARVDELLEQLRRRPHEHRRRRRRALPVERTHGRPVVPDRDGGPVEDDGAEPTADAVARAAASFRALAAAAEADAGEVEEGSEQLSFRLAAQVELAPETKQELLELRSEQRRLELVAEMLDGVRSVLIATRELGERAKKNGSRLT